MKRFFAIVLLSVHLFNLGGYALLYQYYIHQSDVQIVKQIFDNKIDDAKLIEIKIPVHFPTIQDWPEYEVIQGQIQLKDAYYDYVRMRMTRDTMFFVCIPNEVKTRLVKANIITARDITDVPLSKKGVSPLKKINSPVEYNLQAFHYYYISCNIASVQISKELSIGLTDPFIASVGKPPDFIS